jgi:hypothetical protein
MACCVGSLAELRWGSVVVAATRGLHGLRFDRLASSEPIDSARPSVQRVTILSASGRGPEQAVSTVSSAPAAERVIVGPNLHPRRPTACRCAVLLVDDDKRRRTQPPDDDPYPLADDVVILDSSWSIAPYAIRHATSVSAPSAQT